MNIVLWLLQALLALVFAAHGWLLVSPPPDLLDVINESMGVGFRFFLGGAEIAGAVGILLPAVTRIAPWLTEVTAACFAFVMVSATISHVIRAEYSSAAITVVLLLVSGFVAYGRWRLQPIGRRGATTHRPRGIATSAGQVV